VLIFIPASNGDGQRRPRARVFLPQCRHIWQSAKSDRYNTIAPAIPRWK
jgi:hypothetical protein